MSFVAELTMPTPSANRYVDALCAELTRLEIDAVRAETGAEISLRRGLGRALVEAGDAALTVRAEGATEEGVRILKFIVGMQLEKVAAEEKPDLVWTGYGADFTVLPNFRELTVARLADVTPHMRRITFSGRDMARFMAREMHVRLLFPPAGLAAPEWPVPGRNGRPEWPPLERRPAARVYTIRAFDPGRDEIDVDFVLHGDEGVAGKWAQAAEPGQVVGILGPGGRDLDPANWYLFAGDETAIPAITRHLQSLPADARGVVLIEVSDAGEDQMLTMPPGVELTWLHRNGIEAGRSKLLTEAVRGVVWPEDKSPCLAWLGAEAATAREIRTFWREDLGLDRDRMLAVAYWRHQMTSETE